MKNDSVERDEWAIGAGEMQQKNSDQNLVCMLCCVCKCYHGCFECYNDCYIDVMMNRTVRIHSIRDGDSPGGGGEGGMERSDEFQKISAGCVKFSQ